jgi:hypothetical protein
VQYKNFDESEWRIIYSEDIKSKFGQIKGIESVKQLEKTSKFYDYLKSEKIEESKWPKYLLPLNMWFSIIIYPSLAVKVEAEKDPVVRSLIEKIKPTLKKDKTSLSSAQYDSCSKPFEIDLEACKNF